MDDIYNRLNSYLKGSSKFGINETIAEFMLTYLSEISTMRASDIAEHCHTSRPSVIRFCREMGYEGYADFRDAVETYCQNVEDKILVPTIPLHVLGDLETFTASLEQWTKLIGEYILCAMLTLDRQKLIRLGQDIVRYQSVYVFGIGMAGLVAEQLRIRLARSGKIIITMGTPRLDMPLTHDKAQTLGILITQHGRVLSAAHEGTGLLAYLRKNCDKTWLITQEPPTQKFGVDETLYVQPDKSIEAEYHTLIFFEEMLGECCRELIEDVSCKE